MFQMMFQLVCEPVQVTPKQTLRYKITYLLILMTIAIFITVCFFKFLVDVMFFMETVDLKYAHYYVYGAIAYMILSIFMVFHVARCVVEQLYDSFDKIRQIQKEEKELFEEKKHLDVV